VGYGGPFDEFRHFYYNAGWQILETRKSTSEDTAPDGLQPEYQYVWSLRYIDARGDAPRSLAGRHRKE